MFQPGGMHRSVGRPRWLNAQGNAMSATALQRRKLPLCRQIFQFGVGSAIGPTSKDANVGVLSVVTFG